MRRFIVRSRFTLIEMMMVLVIVMAMSAFSVGLYNYTRNIMAETKTKALIVRLDTAFRELYEKYGKYPQSVQGGTLLFPDIFDDLDDEADLLKTLREEEYSCLKGLSDDYIKDFINKLDLPNLLRENGWKIESDTYKDYYCLLDGWTRPLYYREPGRWNSESFDLCSAGADGNAFRMDLSSTPGDGTESDWQEEWAKEDYVIENIWNMDEYSLNENSTGDWTPATENASGNLYFSSVYGDDITNF